MGTPNMALNLVGLHPMHENERLSAVAPFSIKFPSLSVIAVFPDGMAVTTAASIGSRLTESITLPLIIPGVCAMTRWVKNTAAIKVRILFTMGKCTGAVSGIYVVYNWQDLGVQLYFFFRAGIFVIKKYFIGRQIRNTRRCVSSPNTDNETLIIKIII